MLAMIIRLVLLCLAQPQPDALELNQSLIERVAPWAHRSPATEPARSGIDTDQVNFDDPRSVFSYVLSRFPDNAVVYPTETYYYYRFNLGPRVVAGNVRLLDAADGKIHIGYFDANEPYASAAATFTSADGVEVKTVGPNQYAVTADGRTVTFRLFGADADRPRNLRLLPDERCISGILDESGIRFFLMYDASVQAFWFVLNPDLEQADRFVPVSPDHPEFRVGQRTRFVVYHDQQFDRDLLVGVLVESVRRNDYYDGPFDQVPPRLGIRKELEAAYPYVQWRGGIDDHGNFMGQDSSRVAISPYEQYNTVGELVTRLSSRLAVVPGPATTAHKWLRLTYESKRDFHRRLIAAGEPMTKEVVNPFDSPATPLVGPVPTLKPLEEWVPRDHEIWVSQGWPADHMRAQSQEWPANHEQIQSKAWPANHRAAVSSTP